MEIPNLAEIHKKYGGKDFVVVSLNVWDKPDGQAKAIKDLNMVWTQLTDATRHATDVYAVDGIPQILLIGKPAVLESCESPEIFRMPLPLSGQALVGAMNMLSQLHQMRLPKRSSDDKQTVEQAKKLLMTQHGITEPEAHRALQQYAMNHGMKMAEYATEIIRTSRETED